MNRKITITVLNGTVSVNGNLHPLLFTQMVSALMTQFDVDELYREFENFEFNDASNYKFQAIMNKQNNESVLTFDPKLKNEDLIPLFYATCIIAENLDVYK